MFVKGHIHHHHIATLIGWLDDQFWMVLEGFDGFGKGRGEIRVRRGGGIEPFNGGSDLLYESPDVGVRG